MQFYDSYIIVIIIIIFYITSSNGRSNSSIYIDGDFIIGALFDIHNSEENGHEKCGSINPEGLKKFHVALTTMDAINRELKTNNMTIGLVVGDTCSSPLKALYETIELAWDTIIPVLTNHSYGNEKKNLEYSKIITPPVIGVLSPDKNLLAIQAQHLLQIFSIPQVGYSVLTSDLINPRKYSTYIRISPFISYEAQAIIDILKFHEWDYISVVSTAGYWGRTEALKFRELAKQKSICIAREDTIPSSTDLKIYNDTIKKLHQNSQAKVIVCFCDSISIHGLLTSTKVQNLTGRFTFIGGISWGKSKEITKDLEEQALGSISLSTTKIQFREDERKYYCNRNNKFHQISDSPSWYEEYQKKFNSCSYIKNKIIDIENSTEIKIDEKMWQISQAMIIMTAALHEELKNRCCSDPRNVTVKDYHCTYDRQCTIMRPFNHTNYMKYLEEVLNQLQELNMDSRNMKIGLGEDEFQFDIVRYEKASDGKFSYNSIGSWKNRTSERMRMLDEYDPGVNQSDKSACSQHCKTGYYKNRNSDGLEISCCWPCTPCEDYQIVTKDSSGCQDCPYGKWPNDKRNKCNNIKAEYVEWNNPRAIVALSFAALGLTMTIIVFGIFIKFNDTPLVVASLRDNHYIILVGIALAHLSVFAATSQPTLFKCFLTMTMPGMSFVIIYASLFTKTRRTSRLLAISKNKNPPINTRTLTRKSMLTTICTLIVFEIIIIGLLFITEPLQPQTEYPSRDRYVLCCTYSQKAVLIPLVLDFFLLCLCTRNAIVTRNVTDNFNETKFIGFAMYTTCVTWIAIICICLVDTFKVIVMSVCVTLSATWILIFLFLPKLYIMIFKPEKNNESIYTSNLILQYSIELSNASNSESHESNDSFITRSLAVQTDESISSSTTNHEECIGCDNCRASSQKLRSKSESEIIKVMRDCPVSFKRSNSSHQIN